MKDYVVIYATPSMNNVHYAFGADNLDHAKEKAVNLVTGEIKGVFETDDLGNPIIENWEDIPVVLFPAYQNYKTREGMVIIDNQKVFIHKHWSYDSSNYPIWKEEGLKGGFLGHLKNNNGKIEIVYED